MSFHRRLVSTYGRIWHTYRSWAPSILLLALIVFIPLGLIDALVVQIDLESIDLDSGVKVVAVVAAVGAITATGLLGEVFFSGAVAVSLTHPEHERAPPLSHIARQLNYGRLIVIDIVYVAMVAVGLLVAIVPGALVFVFFGLAGPVVELEERTVRGALGRSFDLVRGNFWHVFWVLVPIEVAGDAIGEGVTHLIHNLLGEGFLASWLAEAGSNIVLSPVFAVAAVLLTLDLIAKKDGAGPTLNPNPTPSARQA